MSSIKSESIVKDELEEDDVVKREEAIRESPKEEGKVEAPVKPEEEAVVEPVSWACKLKPSCSNLEALIG